MTFIILFPVFFQVLTSGPSLLRVLDTNYIPCGIHVTKIPQLQDPPVGPYKKNFCMKEKITIETS